MVERVVAMQALHMGLDFFAEPFRCGNQIVDSDTLLPQLGDEFLRHGRKIAGFPSVKLDQGQEIPPTLGGGGSCGPPIVTGGAFELHARRWWPSRLRHAGHSNPVPISKSTDHQC